MREYCGYILAAVLVVASVLAMSSVQAGTVAQMYCKQEYLGLYVADDTGIEVMGSTTALLENEHTRNFVMDVSKTTDKMEYIDVCTLPEEERGEDI